MADKEHRLTDEKDETVIEIFDQIASKKSSDWWSGKEGSENR